MRLRAATVADLAALLTVQCACAEAPQWSRAVWIEMLGSARGILLVVGDEIVSGFVVVNVVGGKAELENIAVLERMRRQGVGRALCERVFSWAKEQGANVVELEVRASNERALQLYASLGFWEQGRRLKYYREPAEDAVLMRVAL